MTALFPGLIEWLNDSFAASAAGYYTELFARIIEFCRTTPEGRPLDAELNRFGLGGREALIARAARLRAESTRPLALGPVGAHRAGHAHWLRRADALGRQPAAALVRDHHRLLRPP